MRNRNRWLMALAAAVLVSGGYVGSQAIQKEGRHKPPHPHRTPTPTPPPKPTPQPPVTPSPTSTPKPTPTPTASPTATPTPVPVPQVRNAHGVYQIMGTNKAVVDATVGLNLDYVDGFNLRFGWSFLEPVEGTYNWDAIWQSIFKAAARGKKISIGIAAGTACPAWLEGAGAKFNDVTVGSEGEMGRMPWPWDPVFLAKWERFVKAFGAEFDGDNAVTNVRMGGFGQVLESYVTKVSGEVEKFKADGGTPKWIDAGKKITAFYVAAFPHVPLVLTQGTPIPGTEGTDALKGLGDTICTAYPRHAGLGMSNWVADTTDAFTPAAQIKKYSHNNPTGCQQLVSVASGGFHGTLAQGFESLKNIGPPWYVEMYAPDFTENNAQVIRDGNAALRKDYTAQ